MRRLALVFTVLLAVFGLLATMQDDVPVPRDAPEAAEPTATSRRRVETPPPQADDATPPAPDESEEPAPSDSGAAVADYVVRVVDKSGEPIAGATVLVVTLAGESIAAPVTDENGRARVPEAGRFGLIRVVNGRGWTSSWTQMRGGSQTLVAKPASGLRGQVVDDRTGSPIAGAKVTVRDTPHESVAAQHPPLARRTTDASGEFELVLVPSERVMVLTVSAMGYAATEVRSRIGTEARPEPVRVELELAGTIVGRVVSPDGDAVADARVVAVRADRAYMDDEALLMTGADARMAARGFIATTTNESGAYRIAGLPTEGAYFVLASADGWAPSPRSEELQLSLERPERTENLTLVRTARLDVIVLAPDGEEAITDATLRTVAMGRFGASKILEPTETGGRYRLERVHPGHVTVRVTTDTYPALALHVELRAGEERVETVRLPKPQRISGIVFDDRGLPIKNANVVAHAVGSSAGGRVTYAATTAADGSFVYPALAPERHVITASASDHVAPSDAPQVEVVAPTGGVTLNLIRTASARFRVRAPEGATPPRQITYSGTAGSGALNWQGRECILRQIRPGEGWIALHVHGYVSVHQTFVAEPGGSVELGEILLDEGVTLRGRVLGPNDEPVADAEVRLVCTDSMGDPTTHTDETGAFELPHASRGENVIAIQAEGRLPARVTVEGDGEPPTRDVRLARGGNLRITVVGEADRPESGALVSLTRVASDGAETSVSGPSTDNKGSCAIRLHPGLYRVSLGGEAESHDVQIVEGSVHDVTLRRR